MNNGFWNKAGTVLIALSLLLSITSIPRAAAQSTQSPKVAGPSSPARASSSRYDSHAQLWSKPDQSAEALRPYISLDSRAAIGKLLSYEEIGGIT